MPVNRLFRLILWRKEIVLLINKIKNMFCQDFLPFFFDISKHSHFITGHFSEYSSENKEYAAANKTYYLEMKIFRSYYLISFNEDF